MDLEISASGERRELSRQDRLLNARSDAQLMLNCGQLVARCQALLDYFEFLDRFMKRDFEVLKVDRFDQKVVRAPIHGDSNILHVSIGRYDNGFQTSIDIGQPGQQR